jgi:hypothetical protein
VPEEIRPDDSGPGRPRPDQPRSDRPQAGRAAVRRPPRGQARVGRAVGKARMPQRAVTAVFLRDSSAALPVFGDPGGGRRRRVRRVAFVVGLVLVLFLTAVWLSQLSGSARPPEPRPCASGSAESCRR